MKKFFILIALAIALTVNVYSQTRRTAASKPSAGDILINYEKQSWEAIKQKDYKFFAEHYPEDFYGLFPQNTALTKAQLIKLFGTFDVNDYKLGNFNVKMLDKSAALITYEVDEQITSGSGKKFLNHNSITSIWAKRSDKWFCLFFQPVILKSSAV